MAKSKKVTGTASSVPIGILYGVLLSVAVTLIGAALSAYLVSTEMIPLEKIGIGSLTTLVVGAAVGALMATARVKRMRMQMCLVTGACYYVLLLAITAIFFGGQYSEMGVTGLAVLTGSGCAALVSAAAEKRGKRGIRKKGYR